MSLIKLKNQKKKNSHNNVNTMRRSPVCFGQTQFNYGVHFM